jgi:2-phosphoglycerate kinase
VAAKQKKLRVVRGDERYRFVLGDVVEALQGVGVPTDDAIGVARRTEAHFTGGRKRIPLDELLAYIASEVEASVGAEASERFLRQTPPFVPISVVRDGAEELFNERILLAPLEKLGLSFKEAYGLARHVGAVLRAEGFERVDQRELDLRVALALETRFGHDVRLRFEATVAEPAAIYVVESDGRRLPYSRGILAQSLMAIALAPELAYGLAKRVEDAVWQRGGAEIERSEVRALVMQLLRDEAGETFALRYELLRAVRRPERPVVLLIGGAPGVGKSAVAAEIAYRLGVRRVVSTDSVRQALRSLIGSELSPVLHSSSYAAWRAELLPSEREAAKPKRKRVVRGFQAQVQQLRPALTAIVERNVHEAVSLVMEGIHLVPGIAPSGDIEGATVVEMVLRVDDEEDHARHFGLREAQTRSSRDMQTYLEHLGEIRMLQRFIVGMAQESEVRIIDTGDFEAAVDQAMEHVLDELLADGVGRDDGAADADVEVEPEAASAEPREVPDAAPEANPGSTEEAAPEGAVAAEGAAVARDAGSGG